MNKQKGFANILIIILGLLIVGIGIYFYSNSDIKKIDTQNQEENLKYYTPTLSQSNLVTNQPLNKSGEEEWSQFSEYWDYYYSPLKNTEGGIIGLTYYGYKDGINAIYNIWKITDSNKIELYKKYTRDKYIEELGDLAEQAKNRNMTIEELKDGLLNRIKFFEKDGYLISIEYGHEPVLSEESLLIID